jgi:hypothetical protein
MAACAALACMGVVCWTEIYTATHGPCCACRFVGLCSKYWKKQTKAETPAKFQPLRRALHCIICCHVGRPHDASRPWAAALLEPGHHGANLPHRSSRPAAATATTGAEYNTPNELWCSVWVSDAHCRSIFVAWHAVLLAATLPRTDALSESPPCARSPQRQHGAANVACEGCGVWIPRTRRHVGDSERCEWWQRSVHCAWLALAIGLHG